VAHGETVNGLTVDEDNIVQSLVYKINHNELMASKVVAYNGQYTVDENGAKVLKNPQTTDHYLVIESVKEGVAGKFDGRIVVEDANAADNAIEVRKDKILSKRGYDNTHLEIFDRELKLKSGKLKPLTENITTNNPNNLFITYKEKLDNLARALSDMAGAFIQNDDESYVSGVSNVDVHNDRAKQVKIGLFSGGTINSLKFNDGLVDGLTQEKLDYLASLQWKTDIDIDRDGGNLTSFSKYNQTLRVQIAEDKEQLDLRKQTQDAVTSALQGSYDKLIKVDKDEEMMNLIKFQAAYEANAKLITMIDEMLNTILNMRR
jgi:flagellar hook-associated protein 1 FlgK